MLDILLITIGIIFVIAGIIGCVLPIIPGPTLSFIAILILQSTNLVAMENNLLWSLFGVTVVITIVDYIFPIWFVKKAGGSKKALMGSVVGLIIGMFAFPPIGIILGPFIGAFVGELMSTNDTFKAIKGGSAAFIGFVFGTLMKIIFSGYIAWLFITEVIVALWN